VRSVYIVASDNDDRELEALVIGVHQHFRSCLASSVGIGGSQDALLNQIFTVLIDLAIYLICGDVDESLQQAMILSTLEQYVGTIDVG